MTVTLEAAGTHLYPGARGVVRDGRLSAAPSLEPTPCMVVFTDGAFTLGTLAPRGGTDWTLAVEAYATGRRTAIPAKRWLVAFTGAGGTPGFRIRAKLPATAD